MRVPTLVVLAVVLAAGCGSSKSNNQNVSCIDAAAARQPTQTNQSEILGACDEESGLAVVFSARNGGQPIDTLTTQQLRFTAARLVSKPGTGLQWQSFINTIEQPGQGPWPGTTPEPQATTDQNGTLDNRGGGICVYHYATSIRNVTSPVAVPYDPNALQRVGFEFRGQGLPPNNPVFTWRPSGAANDNTREIVETATCNHCHGPLAAHGGARTNTDYCVTCHNPGSADAQSGNSVDFKILIHKIHEGADLPSVQAGHLYIIWGFNNQGSDFSTVVFPQPVSNCRACHAATDPATPQGDYWLLFPSLEACGACHDNVSFAATTPAGMIAHTGGPVANDLACTGCHSPDGISSVHAGLYATANNPEVQAGAPAVQYELRDLTLTGNQPVVTLRILVNNQLLDLRQSTFPGGLSFTNPADPTARPVSPRLQVAWRSPEDQVPTPADNNSTGNPLGQPTAVTLSSVVSRLTANPDGSFTTAPGVLGTVPAGVVDVSVGMEGLFYVKLANKQVDEIGGGSAVVGTTNPPQRVIVDVAKCNVCHDRLNAHGGNRANNTQICVLCHDPRATDRGRRPATAAQAVDGLAEQSIDFREMIHKIHTGTNLNEAQYVIYGFATPTTGAPNDFKGVRFPGDRTNCLICHVDSSFKVPIDPNALSTTKLTGTDLTSPNDDEKVSPTGAACTGCHDAPQTLSHAYVSVDQYSTTLHGTQQDNCPQCHGDGASLDVSTVHPGLSGASGVSGASTGAP